MSETFDPEKVERTKWVYYGHEGWSPWPDIPQNEDIHGDGEIKSTVPSSEYDQLLSAFRATKLEIAKLSNRCDELLATGNALAVELDKARKER